MISIWIDEDKSETNLNSRDEKCIFAFCWHLCVGWQMSITNLYVMFLLFPSHFVHLPFSQPWFELLIYSFLRHCLQLMELMGPNRELMRKNDVLVLKYSTLGRWFGLVFPKDNDNICKGARDISLRTHLSIIFGGFF